MIALSSHRPHHKSVEFRHNQLLAKRSWEGAFTKIIYAGIEEPELHSQKTTFIQAEDWPRIQTLAQIAAEQQGIVAILNADIVVNNRLREVENRMWARGGVCGSSRRYHFDAHTPDLTHAKLIESDRGRDIFIARQNIWKRIAREVPEYLRIGHQQWDAWMTDFFREHYNQRFIDFTAMKCIFHPKHEDRQMPYANEIVERKAA